MFITKTTIWSQIFSNFMSKNLTCSLGKWSIESTTSTAKSTSPRLLDTTFFARSALLWKTAMWNLSNSMYSGKWLHFFLGMIRWHDACTLPIVCRLELKCIFSVTVTVFSYIFTFKMWIFREWTALSNQWRKIYCFH